MSNSSFSSTSLLWDHGAGLYTFPSSLSLSGDVVIEDLLTDIPILSVGLLSFGVFTFFFVMKRINSLSVVLYSSVFFAFTASIFDLGQVLTGDRRNTDNGMDLDAVTGLIAAREILFAVSVGLRFFFFWIFVAEPPRGETVQAAPHDPIAKLLTEQKHSGAWGSWGITGIFLKWVLLAICFTIGVLQIIWRVVPSDNQLGPVYGAETAMEIIASALFVIKLLLNTVITPVTPRSKTFRRYTAMFFALLINLGLGIGNVITFAFTECTLGRFLLAVEFYVLTVFVLVNAFYNYVPKSADAKPKTTFQGVPAIKRVSTFRVKPPVTENPVIAIDNSYQNHPYGEGRPERPSRSSTTSRLSSWIVSRRMSRRRSVGSGDRVQLWNQDEAERGESPVEKVVIDGRGSPYDLPIGQTKENRNRKDPTATTAMNDPQPNASMSRWTATTASRNSIGDNAKNSSNNESDLPTIRPPRMPRFDSTAYSIGSYYSDGPGKSVLNTSSTTAATRQTESPVYGLNGIVLRANQGRETPASVARTRSSAVSFTELLRQQTELDKSIAALRLLSPQQEFKRDSSDLVDGPVSAGGAKELNRSNSSVGMPSSMRSEFSLSNFPSPPLTFTATANGIPSPTSTLKAPFDRNEERRSRLMSKSDGVTGLPLPRMPVLNDYPSTPQSMPDSPGRNSEDTGDMSGNVSRMKVDSAGTQYDVTSFIGNLTTPGFKKSPAFDKLTVIDSEDGFSESNGGETTPRTTTISSPRQMYVDTSSVIPPSISDGISGPLAASNGALTSLAKADVEKVVSKLPLQATKSPGPQTNASNRPIYHRKISSNILPSLTVDSSLDSQTDTAPYQSTGGIVGATEEGGINGRRRAPPAGSIMGLPVRPRLTISGPKAPPQDGKRDQAPSAFEKPRPPPLILQQANGKPPGIGGSF